MRMALFDELSKLAESQPPNTAREHLRRRMKVFKRALLTSGAAAAGSALGYGTGMLLDRAVSKSSIGKNLGQSFRNMPQEQRQRLIAGPLALANAILMGGVAYHQMRIRDEINKP